MKARYIQNVSVYPSTFSSENASGALAHLSRRQELPKIIILEHFSRFALVLHHQNLTHTRSRPRLTGNLGLRNPRPRRCLVLPHG